MIQTGLARLVAHPESLKGQRIGLVTHPGAVLPNMVHAVDALLGAGLELTAIFGPEHGLDGSHADGKPVSHAVDARTGLPVYSLYGPGAEPAPPMLQNVDVLVFDLQDVGARFYTFISTLYYVLRGAGKAGKPVLVLDRPNPINGNEIEGPPIEPGFESFVGVVALPIRHGLTTAELARYLNAEHHLGAKLTVVELEGWKREMWWDQTGLPWVPLSPAMPQFATACVYPGMCLVEGTSLSEGRGTSLPFEIAGAPWLDGYALARTLRQPNLPGVLFRPAHFIPAASKHAGVVCHGVQLHVANRSLFRPVRMALHVLGAARDQDRDRFRVREPSVEGRPCALDLLTGSTLVRDGLEQGWHAEEITAGWGDYEAEFAVKRRPYLLYD